MRSSLPFFCKARISADAAATSVMAHRAPDVCDGTSAVGESRHRIPGASVGQPTEPCLALPQREAAGALFGPDPHWPLENASLAFSRGLAGRSADPQDRPTGSALLGNFWFNNSL